MSNRARGIVVGTLLADGMIWVLWFVLATTAHGGMSIGVPVITTMVGIGLCARVIYDSRPKADEMAYAEAVERASVHAARGNRRSQAILLALAVASSVAAIVIIVIGGLAVHSAHQNHTGTHALQQIRLNQANGELGSGVLLLLMSLAIWCAVWWRSRRKARLAAPPLTGTTLKPSSTASAPPAKAVSPRLLAILNTIRVVAPVVFLGLGVYGLNTGWHDRSLTLPIPGGVTTTGHVVKVVTYQGKSTTYAAVVEFRTRQGRLQRFEGEYGSSDPAIGSPATVSYDPAKPADAHDLTDNTGGWKWPFYTSLFITAIGSLYTITLVVVLIRRRTRPSTPTSHGESQTG